MAMSSADDSRCTVLHVDMDAFYASVEVLDDPRLRAKPLFVAGGGNRGVVLSATYEARRYGVHSAMPVYRARRLCPEALVLAPRFERYSAASAAIMAVFQSVTPVVQPLSMDEAFLDIRGAVRALGSPAQIAALVKARIYEEVGLPCTVGVADSLFIAKVASTHAKPDGLLVIAPEDVISFLHPLPVTALWGVGARTADVLARWGMRTVQDLAHTPVTTLVQALGQAQGAHLAALAWGRDERQVSPHALEKSIGADETFQQDVTDPQIVHRELLRLSERVARRLRTGQWQARTVTVRLRFSDFTTITRTRTLHDPTDVAAILYATVCELYGAVARGRALRLVGVRAEGLIRTGSTAMQLSFAEPSRDRRQAELASDRVQERFGAGMVRPGSLVPEPRTN